MNQWEVVVWVCGFAMQGQSCIIWKTSVCVMGRTADPWKYEAVPEINEESHFLISGLCDYTLLPTCTC